MLVTIKRVLQILTYVIIFEVVLGGAGRVVAFGPISIRMMLFGITFLLLCIYYFYSDIDIKAVIRSNTFIKLILIFFAYILFSATYGYVFQHHSLSMIVGDITAYITLFLVFLFNITVQDKDDVKVICSIIVVATSIQAIMIVAIHYILALNITYIEAINVWLQKLYIGSLATIYNDAVRIFFKSSIFLQVGFILALVLIYKEKNKKNLYMEYIALIIIAYATILTFTRGFWLGLVIGFIILAVSNKLRYFSKTIIILLLGLVLMFGLSFATYRSTNLMISVASRAGIAKLPSSTVNNVPTDTAGTSDDAEGQDVSAVYRSKMNIYLVEYIRKSPIIGNGLGTVIAELKQQTSRNENMYFDIWLEMGIIGLGLYLSIMILVFKNWINARKKNITDPDLIYLDALVAGLAGIMVTTAINPYLNNPMGITYLLCVIASVSVFKNQSKFGKVIDYQRR